MEEMKAEEELAAAATGASITEVASSTVNLKIPAITPVVVRPPSHHRPAISSLNDQLPALPYPQPTSFPHNSYISSGVIVVDQHEAGVDQFKDSPKSSSSANPRFPSDFCGEQWPQNPGQPPHQLLVPERFYAMMSPEPSDAGTSESPSNRQMPPGGQNGDKDTSVPAANSFGGTEQHAGSSTSPTSGNSGTQESIFKTIMKRLSVLERNATLSYIYLEEQSKVLNEIFTHSMGREQERFEVLLNHYNRTLFRIFTDLVRGSCGIGAVRRPELMQHRVTAWRVQSYMGSITCRSGIAAGCCGHEDKRS